MKKRQEKQGKKTTDAQTTAEFTQREPKVTKQEPSTDTKPMAAPEPTAEPEPTATQEPTAESEPTATQEQTAHQEQTASQEQTAPQEPVTVQEPAEVPEKAEVPEPTDNPEPTDIPEPTDNPEPADTPEPADIPEPADTPEKPAATAAAPEPLNNVEPEPTDQKQSWQKACDVFCTQHNVPDSDRQNLLSTLQTIADELTASSPSDTTLQTIIRAITYDRDVVQAEIRGRNARIEQILAQQQPSSQIHQLGSTNPAPSRPALPYSLIGGLTAADRQTIWERGKEKRIRH